MPAPYEAVTLLRDVEVKTGLDNDGRWYGHVTVNLGLLAYLDGYAFKAADQSAALRDALAAAGRELAAFRAVLVLLLLGCVSQPVHAGGADAR